MFMNDKEPTELDKRVDAGLMMLKMDGEFDEANAAFSKQEFGMCFDCRCLCAFKTEYGRAFGKCYEFNLIMRGIDKVKHCNRYDKKGQMKIDDMKEMAVLIENDKKVVGFAF